MGNNEPQVPPTDHLCRPAGAVRMAQSVETVTAHAPFARPLLRHRIGSGRLGQGCVEGRVKRRYLWDLWQDLLDRCNAVQAGRVVERRQLCQFPYRPLDLWRDPHRGGVPLAAVNDAMSHGLEFSEYAQRCRRASLQVVEDASDGISVLFQLQLLADFLMARATENQPRRFCRPVDAALGQQQIAFSFEEAEFEAAGAGVTNQNFHFSLRHNRSLVIAVWASFQHGECRPTAELLAQTGCARSPTRSGSPCSAGRICRLPARHRASGRRAPAGNARSKKVARHLRPRGNVSAHDLPARRPRSAILLRGSHPETAASQGAPCGCQW